MERRTDALSQFDTDVARCAKGGGALSRWEIQVTRLRAKSPQSPAYPSKKAVLVASVGCVVARPFQGFAAREVLS